MTINIHILDDLIMLYLIVMKVCAMYVDCHSGVLTQFRGQDILQPTT